jgi:hypothetical protein
MAVVGDGQSAAMALKQGDTEIPLQFLDGVGHRRLADRETVCSAGNGALLRRRDEILELPEGEGHGALKHWQPGRSIAIEATMSSRAHTQAAQERQVRRLCRPYNLSLLIAQKRNPKIDAHGGYMLRDEDFKIVFGNEKYDFSATLEECEEFLLEQNRINRI